VKELERSYRKLCELEKNKHLAPRYSSAIKELANYYKLNQTPGEGSTSSSFTKSNNSATTQYASTEPQGPTW